MRLLLSIPLILLLLFSGVKVKFAAHYCGGHVVATKVTLNGELATCGMEMPTDVKTTENSITNHCCDDVTSEYSINNNYFPSTFSVEKSFPQVINLFIADLDCYDDQESIISTTTKNNRPPGTKNLDSFDQPVLCIFRI